MPPHLVELHFARMLHHGFTHQETARLLNRRKQNSVEVLMNWYRDAFHVAKAKWSKQNASVVGDKSPDLYLDPQLVQKLASEDRLLYSIRDPRAIFRSIVRSSETTTQEMHVRWATFRDNVEIWEKHLDSDNVMVVRYEDLVRFPETTMRKVYRHVGVDYSDRFLQLFPRSYPTRFHLGKSYRQTVRNSKQL